MAKKKQRVRGAGGGKDDQNQHTPVESPDTLRSISRANVLDLVSEGPIDGPVDKSGAMTWVYLDGTPVQNADGTFNFTGVSVAWTIGTQTQGYIPGFPEVESEQVVSTQVKVSASVTRTITDANANAVRVTLGIPQLFSTDTNTGDVGGAQVEYAIDVQSNGGGFVQKHHHMIIGKTMSLFEWGVRVELTGSAPWDIRVRRITADSVSSSLKNDSWWQRMTTIYDQAYSYPNSALCGVSIDASQFNHIPVRGYDLKLLKVQVPTNYDPINRVYATSGAGTTGGVWDGTFKVAWTDNPAWHYYDMLTNTRYGAGKRIPASKVDKFGLYVISQYCDGYVPTGKKKRAAITTGSVTLSSAAADNSINRTTGRFCLPTSGVIGTAVTFQTSPNKLIRSVGSWLTDGFATGDTVTISGAANQGNNVSTTISAVTATDMTVAATLTAESTGNIKVVATAGTADGFAPGDEALVSGFVTSTDNGRVRVLSVLPLKLKVDPLSRTLTDETAAAGRTVALQDFTEPRFTGNTYFQTQEQAFRVLQNMASVFRGMLYWANGTVGVVQDAPRTASALFNKSNVRNGKFSYTGSSLQARHTAVLVTYNDPADGYAQKQELVDDKAAIARYGIRTTQSVAIGCASRSQARRQGLWILNSEKSQPEVVVFGTGLMGALSTAISPGAVINVQDPDRAGKVFGGFLSSSIASTTTVLQLDTEVTLEAGKTYTLMAMQPDGTMQEHPVTTGTGPTKTLTVSPAFTLAPQLGAAWILNANDLSPLQYQVLGVAEHNDDGELWYEITAITYNGSKYAAVELGLPIQDAVTTAIPVNLAAYNLVVGEELYIKSGTLYSKLTATWAYPTGAVGFDVEWRKDNGHWQKVQNVVANHAEVFDIATGAYDVRVTARYRFGMSNPVIASYTVVGKAAPPANVAGFAATWSANGLTLSWTPNTELDLQGYEVRQGASWAAGTPVGGGTAGTGTKLGKLTSLLIALPALPPATFWVAALDTTGHYSTTPQSITPTNPSTTFGSLAISHGTTRPV